MVLLYGGAMYYRKNIIFENNTADLKHSHPIINLFTTDEHDEYAYILRITSDPNRVRDHKSIYIPIMVKKQSYANLSDIMEVPNVIRHKYSVIDSFEYKDILNKFYEYQINNPGNKEFDKIKSRIETILEMLEVSKGNKVIMEDFINNAHLQRYLSNNKVMTDKVKHLVIETITELKSGSKDNNGEIRDQAFKTVLKNEFKVFSTYIQNSEYLENDDVIDGSSKNYFRLKDYYSKLQSKYGMLNVNQLLLAQVAMEYRDDTSAVKIKKLKNIEEFIEKELKRDIEKKIIKEQKAKEKKLQKEEEMKRKRYKKEKVRKRRDEKEYGRWNGFSK